jgi:RHS repeat-associated protein
LGSIRALTNGSGAVVRTADYDAYGQVVSTSGSTSTPFGYASEYRDTETGFLYLRARYYDPASQQFLTVDPLLAATEQAYTYAGGSPTNATDPAGLDFDIPGYVDPADNDWDAFQREANRRMGLPIPGSVRYNSSRGSGEDFGIYRAPCPYQADIGARFKHGKGYNTDTDATTAFVEAVLSEGPTVGVSVASAIIIGPGRGAHIFRNAPGHLPQDTHANRQLLEGVANNPTNYMGLDRHGNDVYVEIQPNGSQVWAYVRGNNIVNAGVNQVPRTWIPGFGLK